MSEALTAFSKVVTYFGDDPKTTTPEQFFSIVHNFAQDMKKAHEKHHQAVAKQQQAQANMAKRLERANSKKAAAEAIAAENMPHKDEEKSNEKETLPTISELLSEESSSIMHVETSVVVLVEEKETVVVEGEFVDGLAASGEVPNQITENVTISVENNDQVERRHDGDDEAEETQLILETPMEVEIEDGVFKASS